MVEHNFLAIYLMQNKLYFLLHPLKLASQPLLVVLCTVSLLLVLPNSLLAQENSENKPKLEQRVQAYWDAKLVGDAVAAYDFEAVKVRDKMPLSQYVRSTGKIIYKEVDLLNIEIISSEQATALLKMEILVPGMLEPLKTNVKDNWVAIDGQWYHAPPKAKLGFAE